MLEIFSSVNFLAVLAAGGVGFLVAGLWYSPLLFAKAWMKENNYSEKDLTDAKPAMAKSAIMSIVLAFGMAVVFKLMAGDHMHWYEGAHWGAFLGLFIHGAAGLPNYLFESRSMKLFLIHIGNSTIGMAVMGAALAAMS